MNRPQKNKVKNPTLPEDQQIDERHLVDAEESAEISVEDRIQMYWMENKGFISGCVFVLALLIIAFNGMRMYKDHAEAQIQANYAAAIANETLADFAQANANKKLGGLAALKIADDAYTAEDYAKATEFYAIAAEGLTDNFLQGRALLGSAFANYYAGDTEAGLSQLRAVVADAAIAEAARAEAAYHLAIEADVAGNEEAYLSYVTMLEESELAAQWQQRIQVYQQQAR